MPLLGTLSTAMPNTLIEPREDTACETASEQEKSQNNKLFLRINKMAIQYMTKISSFLTVDATFDIMVFNSEDSVVGFLSISNDSVFINWLNGEDVKDSGMNSLSCKCLLCF